jgi:hypothetical protein
MSGTTAARATSRPISWQSRLMLVAACAVLLALRKPWALHTPQLWAEDGSIFLTQDEQMGVRAWWEPYNGYLHLLPRLIAWVASHTADPAWWPAIYNGLAFAISVGLFARLASPRVELPAKPWLMLALVCTVGTGEVLINVTNLQWVTAFFLLIQLFTTPARNAWQRAADLAILLLVGLNGPFAIMFAPLFAWRAWRERNGDTVLALGAISLCALVQGRLLLSTGPGMNLYGGGQPFSLLTFCSIIGSRLVSWPFLGPYAVRTLPPWSHAIIGVVVIVPLLLWALRRDERHRWRVMIVAAFCLITAASVYRARADTWTRDDLTNGDRYFYIPRVLLTWLVIWEFNARPRVIAWLARGLGVLALMLHAPRFKLPAPPDYRWAEHCDPIRRGVPANIYTLPEGWWIEYPGRPAKP